MARSKYKTKIKGNSLLHLFFDFYALNEIWFRTVGLTTYGYAATKILPYNKERKIDDTFQQRIATLKAEVIGALETSVRNEIRHWKDHTYSTYTTWKNEDYLELPTDKPAVVERFNLKKKKMQDMKALPLEVISILFHCRKTWESEYGGPKWGTAVDFLIKLKASTNLKDDIFLIDRIFDLQHNNGFVLNKTSFWILENKGAKKRDKLGRVRKMQPLNFRFSAKLHELIDNCSIAVRNIYRANLNYLT